MQEVYTFNGFAPSRQMIKVVPQWAKTSAADSGRNQFGYMDDKVLFAVQAYTVTFPTLGKADMTGLLSRVTAKGHLDFHYFNPVTGTWMTEEFYVENISADGLMVEEGKEKLYGLTFQITAINPL